MSVAKRSSFLLGLLLITLTAAINTNAQVFFSDFNSGVPAGASIPAGPATDPNEAKVDGGYLKLTDAVNGTGGIFYIDDFSGGSVTRFTATFKAAIFGSLCCGGGTLPADGFSFNLAPAASVVPNPAYGQPAEEGLNEGLAVNFDTWDNGGAEAPSIEVKWLGTVVGRVAIQPSQSPLGITDPVAASKDVFINLDPDGKISVSYGGTVIFDHLQTPYDAATIGTPKWVLGARTGGANDNHWIDDLRIVTASAATRLFAMTGDIWRVNESNNLDLVNWTAVDYDEAAEGWKEGPGLLSNDTGNTTIAPLIGTVLLGPRQAGEGGILQHSTYFRKQFNWGSPVAPGTLMTIDARIDDGVIFFLNGTEIGRIRIPAEAPVVFASSDLASGLPCTGDADCGIDILSVDGSSFGLRQGVNVLSAIVYQEGANSSDMVFGAGLTITAPVPPTITDPSQPTNRVVFANRSTTLTVSAFGSPEPTYQWFKDGVAINVADNPTANSASLVIPIMQPTDAGLYYAQVANAVGSVNSRTANVEYLNDVTPPVVVKATGNATFDRIVVEFDELIDPTTATDVFNFSVSDGVTSVNPLSISLNGRFLTLAMEFPYAEDTLFTVTVTGVKDLTGNDIAGDNTATFRSFSFSAGLLNFSVFRGFPGASTADMDAMIASPRYPDSPDNRLFLARFDSTSAGGVYANNSIENYGARIVGLFVPPTSGNWIFYLRSDDASRLWLNPAGSSAAGKTIIQEEIACCGTFEGHTSAPQTLTAGERYYIEAVYKEGGGGDYVQVAAKLETDPTPPNSLPPIPGHMLGFFGDSAGASVNLTQQPVPVTTSENQPATFTAGGTGGFAGGNLVTFIWQRSDDAGATFTSVLAQSPTNGVSSYTIPLPTLIADNGALFRVILQVPGASVTSDTVALTVVQDITPPALVSASGSDTMDKITLRFSELMDPGSAIDNFNYTVSGGLSVATAILLADGRTVIVTLTSRMLENTDYTVTATGLSDRATPPNPIGANNSVTFHSFVFSRGFAVKEYYLNYTAGLDPLIANETLLLSPSMSSFVPLWEMNTADEFDSYGGRIRSYFVPLESGPHTFYLATDDPGKLFLSTDESPVNKVLIASEPVWASRRQWTGLRDDGSDAGRAGVNVSAPIDLTAGQRYYMESLFVEGGGGDHMAVAVQRPGAPAPVNKSTPVPGNVMGVFADPQGAIINITTQPGDILFVLNPDTGATGPLYSQDFNSGDGGFTVNNSGVPATPWNYSAASGSWSCAHVEPCGPGQNASRLVSPPITVTKTGGLGVSLVHRYSFEGDNWDGGQLQISVNGGPFTTVPASAFTANGYTSLSFIGNHQLLGQPGWNGNSAEYASGSKITSTGNLGFANAGDVVQVQLVGAWDECTTAQTPSWEVDALTLTEGNQTSTLRVVADASRPSVPNQAIFYEWQRNDGSGWVAVLGGNGPELALTPKLTDNGAKFRVYLSIPGATVISSEATLTVVQPNTPPKFTCGPNENRSEDSGARSVPGWATDIVAHSFTRSITAFSSTFDSLPAGSRILDPSATDGVVPRVEDGVLKLSNAENLGAGGFGGWAVGPFPVQTFESIEAKWKSLVGGGGNGGADGYSLNLGTDLADNFQGEEGTGTGLTVTVDTFDNGTGADVGVDIKWKGARIAYANMAKDDDGSGTFVRKDQFVDAALTVSPSGLATLAYDNVTISGQIPNYAGVPVNQVNFGAREGGANDRHWIDDIDLKGFPFDASSAEAGQTVEFITSNSNPSLFSVQPAVDASGNLSYALAPNACGVANVTVVAKDNGGTAFGGRDTSEPCNLVINVACENDCPTASPLSVSVDQGATLNIQLLGSDPDGDALQYSIIQAPAHGNVSLQVQTGAASYTPAAGYSGPDSFSYAVNDGVCLSPPAVVNITVIGGGNLAPTARITATPLADFTPEVPEKLLISCNGSNACLLLDGSLSSDPESPLSALTFDWYLLTPAPVQFASGMLATTCLELGTHTISLVVTDPAGATGSDALTVEVVSSGEAIEELISKINESSVSRKNKRPFIASLKAAAASAERGQAHTAANQLHAFQNKVRAQVSKDNPADAAIWTRWAQQVIDALDRCEE